MFKGDIGANLIVLYNVTEINLRLVFDVRDVDVNERVGNIFLPEYSYNRLLFGQLLDLE